MKMTNLKGNSTHSLPTGNTKLRYKKSILFRKNTFSKKILRGEVYKGIIIKTTSYGIFVKLEYFKSISILCNIPNWINDTPKVGEICIIEIARIRKDGKIDGRIKRILKPSKGNKQLYTNKFPGQGLYFISNKCAVIPHNNGLAIFKNNKFVVISSKELINLLNIELEKGSFIRKDILK
jgi:predicted RNA-binding protein with RPS1 domain